jgi:hypothetical protein
MFFTKVILLKMKLFETTDSKSVTSVKIGLNTKASDRKASDSYVITRTVSFPHRRVRVQSFDHSVQKGSPMSNKCLEMFKEAEQIRVQFIVNDTP